MSDTLITHRTIGGIAGTSAPAYSLPLRVAPATEKQHNTLKSRLVPLACWKVEDVRFEFDSSFPRPEIGLELPALGALIDAHTVDGVKPPLSLFGHADPVGDEEYNKTLSGRRARAIYALLTRDVDMWEKLYTQPFGGDNWQSARTVDTMLYRVGYGASVSEVKRFQADNGLASDGVVGPNTRKVLYKNYMDASCPFLCEKKDFLGGGLDAGGKGDYQGCSEFNPLMVFSKPEETAFGGAPDKHERNEANAPNRRVLALLFRPGMMVSTEAWPCPRTDEGCQGCRARFFTDGDARRSPTEERRYGQDTHDTFACRFYHLMTHRSPCEQTLGTTGEPRGDAEGNDEPEIIDLDDLEDLTRNDLVSKGFINEPGESSPTVDESTVFGLTPGAGAPRKLEPITVGAPKGKGKLPIVQPRHAPTIPTLNEQDLKDLLDGVYEGKGAYKSDASGFADTKLDAMLREIGKFWFDGGQTPLDTTRADGGASYKPLDTTGSGGGDTNSKDITVIPVWIHAMQARMFGVDPREFKSEFKPYLHATTRLMQSFLNTWAKNLNGELHSSIEEFFFHIGKSETNNQSGVLMGPKGAVDWCGAASTVALCRGCFRYGLTFAAPAVPGVNEGEQKKYPILQTKFTGRFTKWSKKTDKQNKPINVHKPTTAALQQALKLNPGDIIYIVNGGRRGPLSGHVATVIKQVKHTPKEGETGAPLDVVYIVSGNAGGAANQEGAVRVEQIEREMPPPPEEYNYEEIAGVSNDYGIAKQRIPQLEKEIAMLTISIELLRAPGSDQNELERRKEQRAKKEAELAIQIAKLTAAEKTANEKKLPLNRDDARFKPGVHAPKERGRSWVVSLYRTGKLDAKNHRAELIAGSDAEMQSGRTLAEMTDVPSSWNPA